MKKPSSRVRNLLTTWLINLTLVLGVISFSGNVSESKSYNPERTKTELREVAKTNTKRTVCFKKVFSQLTPAFHPQQTQADFTYRLLQQDLQIKTKFRISVREKTTIVIRDHYLITHSHISSEESDMDDRG